MFDGVEHFNKNNQLANKQYEIRSSMSTADVLTIITHKITR